MILEKAESEKDLKYLFLISSSLGVFVAQNPINIKGE